MITNKAYHSCWHALFVLSSRSRSQSSCYSPHFARHTAEMRYLLALPPASAPPVIPQKCGIQKLGILRSFLMSYRRNALFTRTSSRLRLARHTAEMQYSVAWYSALVLNVIPQKCAIYSHFLPPPPRPYTAEMRYPVAGFIASVFITLPYSDGTCKDSYEEKTLPPLSFCARCGILIHLIPLYSFANQNV